MQNVWSANQMGPFTQGPQSLPFRPQMYGQPQWQQQPQMNPNQQLAALIGGRAGLGNPFNDPYSGIRQQGPNYGQVPGGGMGFFPPQGGPMQAPNAKMGGGPQGMTPDWQQRMPGAVNARAQGLPFMQAPQTSSWSSQGQAPQRQPWRGPGVGTSGLGFS